jgi:hypothetical protein
MSTFKLRSDWSKVANSKLRILFATMTIEMAVSAVKTAYNEFQTEVVGTKANIIR